MRWLGRTILILLAIVTLAVPALWIGRDVVPPRLVRWAVNHAAGAEVIDDLAFRITGLSTGHVALLDLRVNRDAALAAERVRLEFEPRELLDGRLRTVTVTGAELGVSIARDGTLDLGSLGPLVAAFGAEPGAAAGEPALRRLDLRDARIRLAGVAKGSLRLDGTLAPTAAGVAGSMDWRVDAETVGAGSPEPVLSVVGEGRATFDRTAGGTRASADIAGGRLERGALVVAGVAGTVALTLPSHGAPEVTAELTAGSATAGGTPLPAPYLHVQADPTGITGTVRLGPSEAPAIAVGAVVEAVAVAEEARHAFRLDARADLARVDALLAAWAGHPPLGLRGAATAELAGRAPIAGPDAAAVWAGTVASGGITVRLESPALPAPLAGRGQGEVRLAAALAAGRLALETAGPAIFDAVLDAAPPGEAGEWLEAGPLQLTLGGAQSFRVTLDSPFEDARIEVAGPGRLTMGTDGHAALDVRAVLRHGAEGWGLERLESADLDAAGLRRGELELERVAVRVEEFTVSPAGPAGRFDATVRASAPAKGIAGAELAAGGRVESDGQGMRVILAGPGRVAADRLAPAAPLAPVEGFVARIAADDRPVLTLPASGGPIEVRLPLDLRATTIASAEPGVWSVALAPVRLTAEAWLEPDGGGRLRARFGGAKATVAPHGVTLEGLAGDARMALAPGGVRLERLDFAARRVADQARLARFAPLSLEGFARGAETAAAPDRLAFKTTLRGADGAFVLDAAGHHSPGSGRGEAALTLFPIRFVPGGLQPADLSPAAAALFRHASGQVSLAGRVRWPGEAVPPNDPLTLTLSKVGFTGSLGTVTGLEGAIALTQVDPPATAPGQLLSATAVDVGIPITAPRIRFRLEPDRVLRLEAVEAQFAGGRVTASDVAVPLDGEQPVPVVLTIEDVDAAQLAEAVDLDGLSATGTLSGWLPLLWDPATGLALRQARLATGAGGGSLRYVPADDATALQDSGEQVSLLLKAIRNFVYESFEVEADGRPGEPFDVKIRLRGANPDLFDGHPIALNVTLTGALDQLFGNLRRSLGLSDVIRRRLEATGGG